MPAVVARRTFMTTDRLRRPATAHGRSARALPSRAAAQTDRLVVALGQWGTETPAALAQTPGRRSRSGTTSTTRSSSATSETFATRPGLATEWKPLQRDADLDVQAPPSGVLFHGSYGEMTGAEARQSMHCRAEASSPTPSGLGLLLPRQPPTASARPTSPTVVMHFKSPAVDRAVALHAVRGLPERDLARSTSRRWASRRRPRTRSAPGPTGMSRASRATITASRPCPTTGARRPSFKELVHPAHPEPATRMAGLRSGEIDITQVFGDFLEQAQKAGLQHPRERPTPPSTGRS